ncbi:pyridoxal-phosphate-dependent aminotransferase family protein [Paraburkholderia sp. SOS3]|uniref:pyridoxal-phosphate-dependent aminotransferase family protein n=1 Tax=Paraburkholderia sp. SOS3 TaxID=1926494 RepID=UPI0009474484|nr:aminotransferase class V-fold PLP-dependent enzyme [Paraburkholderia sp. SOS3]APR38368.1 aspartate aminotransferase [Paraburkholderia sp. SOS3]
MTTRFAPHFLLDPPRYPAERFAPLADRAKRLLGTTADLVFIQSDAMLALQTAAASIARPGTTAVNIVTSPYGVWFGTWLRRGGMKVRDVKAGPGQPVDIDAVVACVEALPSVDVVACVHAESSNGVLNPLPQIAALARSHDAFCVVDAVASVGGHALEFDAWGIDIAVASAQKALSGPAGVSFVAVSQRAWRRVVQTPDEAPSILSLWDLKRNWLERGRGALPGTPATLEFWALEAAFDRVDAQGIDALIARHARATRATRMGLRALGVVPPVARDDAASALITAAPVPEGVDVAAMLAHAADKGVELTRGFGDTGANIVRLNHTGVRAAFEAVLANVVAYGSALDEQRFAVDVGGAAQAVREAYSMR